MIRTPWSSLLLTVLVLASGCATSDSTDEPAIWGQEALGYFEAWAEAYTENDAYGVLDFYSPTATIQERTGIFRDATPSVPTVLRGNTDKLTRNILDVYLGTDQAIALVVWPDYLTEYGAVMTNIADGFIASEIILLDAFTLENSLRASPENIATYETVFGNLAAAWTEGDPGRLTALYASDATIGEPLSGLELSGHTAIVQLAAQRQESWATALLPGTDKGGTVTSSALFLDPVAYGADPLRAVGVYEITGEGDCTFRTAVHWRFADGVVVEERRYPEVESFRQCESNDLVDGWWTDLDPPGPRDVVETGVIATSSGNSISVRNGTPRLQDLVLWGLNQYAAAGLSEPRVDTVTFEPSRQCEGVAGRLIAAGIARDLVLCIYETELGTDSQKGAGFALGARVGMLHELAHAWILDEVADATKDRVLELSNRDQWIDDEAPWKDRGVEYAAQVIAWGLSDEPIQLVELGRPSCSEVTVVFEILVGTSPLEPGCIP